MSHLGQMFLFTPECWFNGSFACLKWKQFRLSGHCFVSGSSGGNKLGSLLPVFPVESVICNDSASSDSEHHRGFPSSVLMCLFLNDIKGVPSQGHGNSYFR